MAASVLCSVETMAAQCKQGSSTSIDWIKKKYKNCTKCTTTKDKKGKKTYSCYCDCDTKETKQEIKKETTKKATTCKKDQFVVDNKCQACPKNGTCDGKTLKCAKGYNRVAKDKSGKTVCACEWKNNGKCETCPAGAKCDGSSSFTCKDGYGEKGDKCVKCPENVTKCYWSSSGKLSVSECKEGYARSYDSKKDDKCVKCPENALRCNVNVSNGRIGITECKKGYGWGNGYMDNRDDKCVKCPEHTERCLIKDGKPISVTCVKGYVHPWRKKGSKVIFDIDSACVKEGKCTISNPC